MSTDSARVVLNVEARKVLADGIRAGVVPLKVREDIDLSNGTTVGEIDVAYAVTETGKAASGSTSYDLLSLTDTYGDTPVFAEVVLILLRNKRTTASAYLTVGPNAANGFGDSGPWTAAADRNRAEPEGWVVYYNPAGWTVDATHKVIDVDTSAVVGDTNTWDLVVLGRSA